MEDTTTACTLDVAEQEKRFGEFAEFASATEVDAIRTPHGARLRLRHSEATKARLLELIEAERRCCSFLEFDVEVDDDTMLVEVSGPPSARLLIDRLFDLESPALETLG